MTRLVASSTWKGLGGISGSGTCFTVTTMCMRLNLLRERSRCGDGLSGLVGLLAGVWDGWPTVERIDHDLGEIADQETLLDVQGAHAVLEHGDTEGAGHGHAAGRRGERLVEPVEADSLAAFLLHERPGAPSTAAKPLVAAAWQLEKLTVSLPEHLARRLVDVVVAAEVAGVVIGVALPDLLTTGRQLETTGRDQLFEELGVVDHLVA